MELEQYNM